MFQLTALNGTTVCTDCCWGPWTFTISCSNYKNKSVRTM